MNRVFKPRGYIRVPDDTYVSAFLNATDASQNDVPWGMLGEMSIAAGRIEPGATSWVHMHPVVTQVTYVVAGQLSIRMKDASAEKPHDLELHPGEAVLSEPGTLCQLRNTSEGVAEVLYIVSPSYVFEMVGDQVVYDDAVLVAKTWEELEATKYTVPTLKVSKPEVVASRAESKRRLVAQKGYKPGPLATEEIQPTRAKYNYLAPDGSEIRLLVEGENGGFAHCVLPAGRISAPVRHRTVEELWYVLDGEGEIWRGREDGERVDPLLPGNSVRIPVDTSFQIRAGEKSDLKLLLGTMPPWPGKQEAVPANGEWPPSGVG